MYGRDETNHPNGFMDIEAFCEYVPGMTKGRAAQLRYTGKGPKYFKPSGRTILYRKEDVDKWIEDSARTGTANV